jgi:hypothetical protein
MLRRALVIIGLLAGLLGCGLAWRVLPSALSAPLILPDASNVVTQWHGPGTMDLRYQTAGAPFAWRGRLSQQLARAGWTGHSYPNIGASHPPFSSIWFTRETHLGPFVLIERVVFDNAPDTPTTASLLVTRTIRRSF